MIWLTLAASVATLCWVTWCVHVSPNPAARARATAWARSATWSLLRIVDT
jgi:hypothetical protein